MVKLNLYIFVSLLLGACASSREPDYYWDRRGGVNQQQWAVDVRQCMSEGQRAAPLSSQGPPRKFQNAADTYAASADMFLDAGRIMLQMQATDLCLNRKGYYKVKK